MNYSHRYKWNFIYALLLIIICSTSNTLWAQITLTGTIVDALSKEGVPFANIYQKSNPTKGVAADFDGKFTLTFDSTPDIIEISALSYETKQITYDGKNNITIELSTSAEMLEEVVIVADKNVEDPAYPILRKVLKNKASNNTLATSTYSCEVYNKMEIDLINISDEFMEMRINKPLKFLFEKIDTTSDEEPFLPMFVSEAISDVYRQSSPRKKKEIVKAVKIAGDSENESVGQLLGVAQAQFNGYDNWLTLLSKDFAGPVGDNATSMYRYYLIDSNYIDDKLCYNIQYFPKHKGINGFYGDFWIQKDRYALKKIKMQLLSEGHLNFVETLSINLEYEMSSDSMWVPKKDYITITSTTITEPFLPPMFKKLRKNAPGVKAKRNTTYKNFSFDKKIVKDNINKDVDVADDAFKKDADFWEENRHVKLSNSEKTAYQLVDTVKNLPVIDVWKRVTTSLFTGYMWGKYIDIGNFYEFVSNNDIEGWRTKFGFRTSTGISKRFMLGGYLAYGWKDEKFKYGGDLLYVFNTIPRRTLGLAYIDDYAAAPNIYPYISRSGKGIGTRSILRRSNIPFKLLDIRNVSANYFHEWKNGLSASIDITNISYKPLFNFNYLAGENNITQYTNSTASLSLRYAFNETFLSGSYLRSSLGSKYPITTLKYTKAFNGIFDSSLDYHKLELKITDRINIGAIGYTRAMFTAGKVWGTAPYLSLYIPKGNEQSVSATNSFNTIPEYAFAADQFAYIGLDHHFDGFLLQWVPLFRKMKIRGVSSFRAIIGDMTEANKEANKFNLYENTTPNDIVRILIPNKEPLMEASVGIENIFRFFRFDFVWRLNYNDVIEAKGFGIRGAARFTL